MASRISSVSRSTIQRFVRGRARSATAPVARAVAAIAIATVALFGAAGDACARTEIEFWHAMQGQLGEAVGELVQQFNRSQAEFEVKAVYKGEYPQVLSSALSAYRKKSAPHLVQVYEVGTQTMLLSNAIVPVYRLMKQQEVAVDWADFVEGISGYYAKDGRLYSMPFNVSTPILYYNRDIFRKAGLGAAPPATWQDVEAAARRILAAGTARCGFSAPYVAWSMLENTFSWHDQPFATNQNGYGGLDTRLLIKSEFGAMHVGALARWQKEGIGVYDGPTGPPDPRFVDGECAMFVQSSAFIGRFKASLGFEWGTGQLPHWGPPYPKANTILGGATLWVLRGRNAADYKGVAQFIRFVVEPRQQAWWAAATGYVPVTKTAVRALEEAGFYQRNPEQWTATSQLLGARPTPNSRGLRLGNYLQVREAIELELQNVFAGRKTAEEALDAAVTRGNAILRQFGVSRGAAAQGEI